MFSVLKNALIKKGQLCESRTILITLSVTSVNIKAPPPKNQKVSKLCKSPIVMLFFHTIALLILSVMILTATTAAHAVAKKKLRPHLKRDLLIANGKKLAFRNGLIGRWAGAVVPYEIPGRFSEKELMGINNAFKEYHNKTCIRFKPRSSERDYIVIKSDKTGCWSSLGRLGGRQVVNLQSALCFRHYGTPMHELMHALGFMHEQNRPERDSYIRVLSQNVKNGTIVNFQKGSAQEHCAFGVPYDYASIMHYARTSFSKNGKPTIEALKQTNDARLMGQRKGFSKGDIAKLNAMYKCKQKNTL